MIVISLALILVAVALLVFGLASGSSALLVVSIGASLLAAVALVAGARQAAAGRAATQREGAGGRSATIPTQHVPSTSDAGVPGWRQPPGSPVTTTMGTAEATTPTAADLTAPTTTAAESMAAADAGVSVATAGAGEPYDDEPGAQEVTPEQAARVSRLLDEVRVVDGRPRYHLDECTHLVGRDHEPLVVAEAVSLGFTPCADCTPDTILLAQSERY
ncbi:hypothetical protein ACGFIK_07930 [Micromonospora sp. NPDC048871]|uniref:hypothetical protein n=1 Tax=unclassified Micromonospora TaxID=2617518 RepID=UPI002E1575D2|nr:hypothetical protein OIE53_02105 [Micromonospora sp. NBC_01739]